MSEWKEPIKSIKRSVYVIHKDNDGNITDRDVADIDVLYFWKDRNKIILVLDEPACLYSDFEVDCSEEDMHREKVGEYNFPCETIEFEGELFDSLGLIKNEEA